MIDINASLGHWPFGPLKYSTPAGLLRQMDRLGICRACVAPLEGLFYRDVQDANQQMLRAIARYRKRLLPFAVINPAFPGWQSDLDECVRDHKIVGVRLFPAYHGYEIGDPCSRELFHQLHDRQLPVQIAPLVADPRMHHPRALVPPARIDALPAILEEFPQLAVCVLNAPGIGGIFPNARRIPKASRLFMDISGIESVSGVARLAETVGVDRLLFGTNAPLLIPLSAVYKLRETDFSKSEHIRVTRANARNFLGRTGASHP